MRFRHLLLLHLQTHQKHLLSIRNGDIRTPALRTLKDILPQLTFDIAVPALHDDRLDHHVKHRLFAKRLLLEGIKGGLEQVGFDAAELPDLDGEFGDLGGVVGLGVLFAHIKQGLDDGIFMHEAAFSRF